jgi:hypothetical protein
MKFNSRNHALSPKISSEYIMQVEVSTPQENAVVELSLDQLELVSGGFPVVPPPAKPN